MAIVNGGNPLIALVALGLVLAFIGGLVAVRLRLSPIIGYLLAGIIMGPYTPGFTGDAQLAAEVADIGVILLMFGVGMHFSVGDLWAMRTVAVPGAIIQILVATSLGAVVAAFWGWTFGAGLVFGLALSVASTVVLLRALQKYKTVGTPDAKIAIGWLVVEDLAMVATLVLLPAFFGHNGGSEAESELARGAAVWLSLGMALVKVAVFIGIMLILGTRLFPWLLRHVERTGSRELFTLAVVALAVGVAFGSEELFGCSLALGAFFAGVVIHQSDLSHRAAATLEPLQDAFGTLFFVAMGMLFDPMILVRHPWQVVTVVAIIVIGKSLAAFGIVLALRRPLSTALMVSAALAQIGEFSFILAAMGVNFGLISIDAENLIIAGALLTIALNPLVFLGSSWLLRIIPASKIGKRLA
ncbi:MAG TPA: cation:proton antiporter [Verrucomicrobiae bacterium]